MYKIYKSKLNDFLYLKKKFNNATYYTPLVDKKLLLDRYLWDTKNNTFISCLIMNKTKINCEWVSIDGISENNSDYSFIGYVVTEKGIKSFETLIKNNSHAKK